MNRRLGIRNIVWLLIVTLLFSCQKEEIESPFVQVEKAIRFQMEQTEDGNYSRAASSNVGAYNKTMVMRSATSADTLTMNVYTQDNIPSTPLSRGAALSSDNLTSFAVYASSTNNNVASSYIKNWQIIRDASTGACTSDKDYIWPGDKYTLQFMALAPYNPQGLTINQGANAVLPVSFTYELPSDAVNQADILLATTPEYAGDYYLDVPLTFRHLCSAVNVKVGSIPQGCIKAITFKNIYNKGTYTIASDVWSVSNTSKTDFAVDFVGTQTEYPTSGNQTGNPQINDASATFMMIPQTLPDDAEMEITFVHSNTGREETLTASLASIVWAMGQTNNYLISITPDCKLEFTTEVETQDAHYVICKVPFRVTNLPEGGEWEMTVSAKDGDTPVDVTVQREALVNDFAKQGFWTDKVMNENAITSESARGTNSITGTANTNGEELAYVFLPENVTDDPREITLTLKQKGKDYNVVTKTITQNCPNWTGNFGWESVDDNEAGPYGFCWTRKVAYIFPYNLGGWPNKYTENEARSLINALIGQYNASSYASIVEYSPGIFQTRVYVWLDYTELNNLSEVNSTSDGLANTQALNTLGGTATTSAFEEVLKNTKKTEEGKETENMFRLKDGDNGVPNSSGENNVSSGILNFVLKKNRYYLRKTYDSAISATTTAPYLKTEDIVWYLPAYEQFSSNTGISGADYWSSTAVNDGTKAYLGNGAQETRTNSHKVIAVRNKP